MIVFKFRNTEGLFVKLSPPGAAGGWMAAPPALPTVAAPPQFHAPKKGSTTLTDTEIRFGCDSVNDHIQSRKH